MLRITKFALLNLLRSSFIIPSDPTEFTFKSSGCISAKVAKLWHFAFKDLNSSLKSIYFILFDCFSARDLVSLSFLFHKFNSFACLVFMMLCLECCASSLELSELSLIIVYQMPYLTFWCSSMSRSFVSTLYYLPQFNFFCMRIMLYYVSKFSVSQLPEFFLEICAILTVKFLNIASAVSFFLSGLSTLNIQ